MLGLNITRTVISVSWICAGFDILNNSVVRVSNNRICAKLVGDNTTSVSKGTVKYSRDQLLTLRESVFHSHSLRNINPNVC